LKRLDELQEKSVDQRVRVEDRIEAAIESRKQTNVSEDDELEALIAARKRKQAEKTAGFCSKCGHPLTQIDKFCSKCGAVVPTD
jgi:hypothetical protein